MMATKKLIVYDKYKTAEVRGKVVRNKEVYDNRRRIALCENCVFFPEKHYIYGRNYCEDIRKEARNKGLLPCQRLSDPMESPDGYAIIYEEIDPLLSDFQKVKEACDEY
jgi:hypothetical protein